MSIERPLVLVVEDEPELAQSMEVKLVSMGFDVRCATHFGAARDQLEAATPGLVCVALELPTESGIELCAYIRGDLGMDDVPILVTSDAASATALADAEDAGASAFLRKPFSMLELERYVSALVCEQPASDAYFRRLGP